MAGLAATVWIPAFAGMTGAKTNFGTCPCKPIKGDGVAAHVFTGTTLSRFTLGFGCVSPQAHRGDCPLIRVLQKAHHPPQLFAYLFYGVSGVFLAEAVEGGAALVVLGYPLAREAAVLNVG